MARRLSEDDDEVLEVLDLPQLYQKPSSQVLLSVLTDLSLAPPSWDNASQQPQRKISSEGIPAYLTKIISSSLPWIADDAQREQIWELAAQRLSERSGRSGMGAITRTFSIPLNAVDNESASLSAEYSVLDLVLHEPALTADNLGLKTWASSYLLAKRLSRLVTTLPAQPPNSVILELGSGTGLVGLAAAAVFKTNVVLTDLPAIVPNLSRNIEANASALAEHGGSAEAIVLDWSAPSNFAGSGSDPDGTFPLILVADPIYSAEHPALLVQAVQHHLSKDRNARVVIELPLREAFAEERADLRDGLEGMGLKVLEDGEGVGYDDWSDGGREGLMEVRCWWSAWGWR